MKICKYETCNYGPIMLGKGLGIYPFYFLLLLFECFGLAEPRTDARAELTAANSPLEVDKTSLSGCQDMPRPRVGRLQCEHPATQFQCWHDNTRHMTNEEAFG